MSQMMVSDYWSLGKEEESCALGSVRERRGMGVGWGEELNWVMKRLLRLVKDDTKLSQ